MEFVATFEIKLVEAKVLVEWLRPLRPVGLALLIGEQKSHDAYDGISKLLVEITNERPNRSI
jgi:hypothetical protein